MQGWPDAWEGPAERPLPCAFTQFTQLRMHTARTRTQAAGGDWSSPGLNTVQDGRVPVFFKTESGVKVQELIPGAGPAPERGDRVLIDYVLRR